MKKVIIKPGTKFGHLIFIEEVGKKNGLILVKCICELCNNIIIRIKGNVMHAKPNEACGCITKTNKYNQISPNSQFNRLTYLHELPTRNTDGDIMWLCQCQCGNIKSYIRYAVINGNTKSCGCLYNLLKDLTTEQKKKRHTEQRNIARKI